MIYEQMMTTDACPSQGIINFEDDTSDAMMVNL